MSEGDKIYLGVFIAMIAILIIVCYVTFFMGDPLIEYNSPDNTQVTSSDTRSECLCGCEKCCS